MKRALHAGTAFATWTLAFCAHGAGVVVYPVGPSIPESLLRIELRLARPLSGTLDPARLKLVDETGRPIAEPFLDLALPSADGTEVTVLMHPGRVKSGVGANMRLGRALRVGSTVTLIIDDPAVGERTQKTWQVTKARSAALDPATWIIQPPLAGSRQPVIVRSDTTFGFTAEWEIALRSPDGSKVGGHASFDEADNAWRFVPEAPWVSGRYALMTHPDLEDVSGNRTCAPFEGAHASLLRCEEGTATAFDIAELARR